MILTWWGLGEHNCSYSGWSHGEPLRYPCVHRTRIGAKCHALINYYFYQALRALAAKADNGRRNNGPRKIMDQRFGI